MNERSPIDELKRDHLVLVDGISAVETAVRNLNPGPSSACGELFGEIEARLDIFNRALHLHFRKEEEALFPDVQQMLTVGAPVADIIGKFFRDEADDDFRAHDILRQRVKGLAGLSNEMKHSSNLEPESLGRLRALADVTKGLLERHRAKEDTLIFPMIERMLDALQMEEVRKRMHILREDSALLTGETF